MTEFESDEEQILARARRAFQPSDADAQRVLRATSAALGLPIALDGVAEELVDVGCGARSTALEVASRGGELTPLAAAAGKSKVPA